MKTTLVAVSGMSPAIITETIWALSRESPAVIPDEVVVITTARGEADIAGQLLAESPGWGGKSPWECLRESILADGKERRKLQLSVRVIELPDEKSGVRRKAVDLRTRSDHDEAADFIVQTLAPLADAEDNHLIASIAGGRKTMGALLYAAMSLLGKESDRVTHVLVSEPFETCRGFFYPDQPLRELQARSAGGENVAVKAKDAAIELADIAFVPLRNRLAELNEPRQTFAGLVERYAREELPELKGPPRMTFDAATGIMEIQGRSIRLTGREILIAGFLYERARNHLPHFERRRDAELPLQEFVASLDEHHPCAVAARGISGKPSEDDITKVLAEIRKKLKEKGLEATIPFLAPERKRIGFDIRG